ncbi:hypothetical protein GCM10010129_67250 [Streptomyces fumigatiscleroticus]|nr:hypothetical protein GCM10010129_67250 [Streptomyces fumigatiscleroticus]
MGVPRRRAGTDPDPGLTAIARQGGTPSGITCGATNTPCACEGIEKRSIVNRRPPRWHGRRRWQRPRRADGSGGGHEDEHVRPTAARGAATATAPRGNLHGSADRTGSSAESRPAAPVSTIIRTTLEDRSWYWWTRVSD